MKLYNNSLKWLLHTTLCTAFITIFFTTTDFINTPIDNVNDFFQLLLHWVCIFISLWCVLLIVSLAQNWVFTIFYTLLTFLSSVLAFYRYTLGFSLNTMIFDIIFQNDVTISSEMVTYHTIVWIVLCTAIGVYLARLGRRYSIAYKKNTWVTVLIAVVVLCFFEKNSRFKNPITKRIPFNIFSVTIDYFSNKQEIHDDRKSVCTEAYIQQNDSCTVVVVIGEALRAKNLHINGYHRQTTPYLESLSVVSFDSIYSEYTYTNKSVPHILTRADSVHPERAYSERSFIDVFKIAGYHTCFISNQDAERPYIYFTHEADEYVTVNISKNVYNYEKWLDEATLPEYYNFLSNNSLHKMVIVHCIGSHWWYNTHFSDDFEIFKPVIKTRFLASCDSMSLVNSYDNTVVYTDWFLSRIIEPLKEKNAIVLFLSDHGEAQGENGHWLHASECEEMHHPASFVWFSKKFEENNKTKCDQAKANKHRHFRSDYLYHSVIDAAAIETNVLDTTLSIFRVQ